MCSVGCNDHIHHSVPERMQVVWRRFKKEETSGAKGLKQDQLILALLENPTNERAAAALGIASVTLWRYMKRPGFADAFRKARREAFSQSIARLQHASNAAVGTLLRVMTDKDAAASSRVRAAEIVLNNSFRGIEIEDFEARVAKLEESLERHRGSR